MTRASHAAALKKHTGVCTRVPVSKNAEAAAILDEIADLLELKEEQFKPAAYRRAAAQIRVYDEDVAGLVGEGRVHEIPGVGASIAEKVVEIVETGRLKYLEKLRKQMPGGLAPLMDLPGLGAKRVALLHKELGIKDAKALKKAAQEGKIAKLEGFGKKTEEAVLEAVSQKKKAMDRFLQSRAQEVTSRFLALIEESGKASRMEVAGSLRRGRDTVGDVDLLVAADEKDAQEIMDIFCSASEIDKVVAHGEKKSSIKLADGLQVDLRVVTPEQYGAALLYFTGSKAHNVALRKRAHGYGWLLNEYGLIRKKDEQRIAGETEEEIYRKLKFDWIPPEIREERGEIEAAKKGKLPKLIEREDVVADLHNHTTDSDGRHSAKRMLEAARDAGLKLYGISDHSYSLRIARGETERLDKQRKQLEKLRGDFPELTILQGSEVNIKKDGSLDTPKKILKDLDYVIGSVHNAFTLDEKEQTKRILKAIDGGMDIYGHPSARRMPNREPIKFDEQKVYEACAQAGVLLEIDGQPERLDMPGEKVHAAKQAGCLFTVDSDAHSATGLEYLDAAVVQARRGWLEAKDVVSTWTPKQIQGVLGRAKKK